MARKSNPRVIGAFVISSIVLAIAGAIAFGGTEYFAQKKKFVLFFTESVAGLNIGSPVNFRGVEIGKVVDVHVRYVPVEKEKEASLLIPVYIEIFPNKVHIKNQETGIVERLVEEGLRAQLVTVSLVTGQATVEFDFHPDQPITLVGADPDTPELPTVPSSMSQLEASISGIVDKISKLPLEQLVADIQTAVGTANDALLSFKQLADNTDGQVDPLVASVKEAVASATSTLADLKQRISLEQGQPGYNLNETLESANRLVTGLETDVTDITKNADKVMASLLVTLDKLETVFEVVKKDYSRDAPIYRQINSTLAELKSTMTSIRAFADYLQRHPDALLVGK
jgi:paraquat-inducible protein B